jgi:folylpolyglutamate synthase/dihydropteroate synthase
LQDKNYRYFIEINAPLVDYFISCNIKNEPKSCKAEDLANLAKNYCFSLSSTTLQQGVEFANSYLVKNSDRNNLVIFTGSLYFAGEVLTFFEVGDS